ncbi:MAG: M48 family metalloprotease [Sulfuritalea sp.]|nr:M48 family metalloprotease [Sulfuritalea sp.]
MSQHNRRRPQAELARIDRWFSRRLSMLHLSLLLVVAALLCLSGCATVPNQERTRMLDMPLASTHADLSFSITTGVRQYAACESGSGCQTAADRDAAQRFALQVERVAGSLQAGAQRLFPDLAQRAPGLAGGVFDVYVVEGAEPGSASSANGRIALTASLGARKPYDDWMAFVIAREMGHVIARHHEENSASGIVTSVLMNILIPGSSLLKSLLSAGGAEIAARSKQEVQALEADLIALELLQEAGFRLRDIYLTLLLDPVDLDDGAWSASFRTSSRNLIVEVRRSEIAERSPSFAVAAAR